MTSSFSNLVGTERDRIPDMPVSNYASTEANMEEAVNKQIDRNIADQEEFFNSIAEIEQLKAKNFNDRLSALGSLVKNVAQFAEVRERNREARESLKFATDVYKDKQAQFLEFQEKKLDITKISILALVNQYLEFIRKTKHMNLDLASDYLVMAAILAYIKSKLLLPSNKDDKENEKEILPELLAFNLKRLKAMREMSYKLFMRDLLNSKRFLKGQILDKAIILETEFGIVAENNHVFLFFDTVSNILSIASWNPMFNISSASSIIK